MQGDLSISLALLYGFLLTLARLSGVFAFLPIPGTHSGPTAARALLSLALTMAVYPKWPAAVTVPDIGTLAAALTGEAVLGLLAGVVVGLITEGLLLGAQVLSLPAGYAYASTFDPNTNADSGILVIFAQLAGGMLFFAAGLDRQVIHAFAASLDTCPPGSFVAGQSMAEGLIALFGSVFSLAIRLALPIVGLLLVVDLAMGVLGRLNPQIQIISLAFPVKMLLSLVLLGSLLTVLPRVYERHAQQMLDGLAAFLVRR
jgi:flagellar biosynthetic protein FliR